MYIHILIHKHIHIHICIYLLSLVPHSLSTFLSSQGFGKKSQNFFCLYFFTLRLLVTGLFFIATISGIVTHDFQNAKSSSHHVTFIKNELFATLCTANHFISVYGLSFLGLLPHWLFFLTLLFGFFFIP